MQSITVVISQADEITAQRMAEGLRTHFHRVVLSGVEELPQNLRKHRASLVVVDMDIVTIEQIQELSQMFEDVAIICTHHAPDAELYLACVEAGATDCCHTSDISSIVRAYRSLPLRNRRAVAA